MEERLKSLMQDLGNAINESLSDSERIAEAIGEISVPATTSSWFWKPRSDSTSATTARIGSDEEPTERAAGNRHHGKVRFTTQDQRFLKALRITVDEEA